MGGLKMKRLKGGAKAHKWKKGQSCISNPETNKFRTQATKGFFETIKNSGLTEDAVAQHQLVMKSLPSAATQSVHLLAITDDLDMPCPSLMSVPRSLPSAKLSIGYNPPPKEVTPKTIVDIQQEMEDMSVNEDDDLKSQAKTFATRFTTCSIPAFENFFNKLSVESEHQVMMLSFHATVQEIIKQKNLPETSSSYFVAIIMSLEGILDKADQVAAGLALLVRVIKNVPLAVLRAKCDIFGGILNTIISTYQDSDNVQLLTHVLGCLSILLRAQQVALWYCDDQLKTWLKNIMVFTMHGQPRVRKSGQYNVSAVLKGSEFMVSSPLRSISDCKINSPGTDTDPLDEDMEGEAVEEEKEEDKSDVPAAAVTPALEVHPGSDLVADFLIGQLQAGGSNTTPAAKKNLLHMLVFTRQIIAAMPKHKLQIILQRLYRLVGLGTGLINKTIMQALQVLCESHPPVAVLPFTLTNSLLKTLTKHTAGVSSAIIAAPHDPVAVESWAGVVTAAVQHAISVDAEAGIVWCTEFVRVALEYWQSDNDRVQHIMKNCLSTSIGCVYDVITTENDKDLETVVRALVHQLEAGLSYQYHSGWRAIFELFGQCYSELGLYYVPIMIPSLKTICEMMASFSVNSVDRTDKRTMDEAEKAIGKAVQGLGVEAVVYAAPISITGNLNMDEKNLWLLPLLRKFTKNSRLMFFKAHFIPLAEKCFDVITNLEDGKGEMPNAARVGLLRTYNQVQYQIWALLPSFSNQARDVEEAQTNRAFAKLICGLIEHSELSRMDAMAALRYMISSENSSKRHLSRNSSNYLPALFNVFMKEPKTARNIDKENVVDGAHRMAALATITAYLKITPQKVSELFMSSTIAKYKEETESVRRRRALSKQVTKSAAEKYKEGTESSHRKRVLLHLARCFVPYVRAPFITTLYEEVVIPLIKDAVDKQEQKAAYRVLEELLSAESEDAVQFVDEQLSELTQLLLNNIKKAAACSRAPKLRCAKVVLGKVSSNAECDTQEDFLRGVVGESVVCCGRTNSSAARKAAFLLLADLPAAMKRIKQIDDDTTVRECMRLLSGGLLERPEFCANTIIAITAYTYQTKETMPIDILQQNVENMSALLECSSREVVQSCLSFIKGVVALYPPAVLGSLLKTIMRGIVSMTPDCARKYRLKTKSILTRLMRKFGDDYICKLVPAKHEILHRRMRNMRKEENRNRRQREAEEQQEEQEEEDKDAEENFTEKAPTSLEEILAEIDPDLTGEDGDGARSSKKQQRKRKNQPTTAWLEEDNSDDEVLDLLGEEAAKAIMTKRPREKKEPANQEEKSTEENGGFAIDPVTGKLIIVDNEKEDRREKDIDHIAVDDMEDMMHMRTGAMGGKITNRKRARDDDDDDDSIDIPLPKRDRKKKFDYGAEFRSKKCRGDVVKKGQTIKPYAYIELRKERLNRRKKAKFEGQFKSVVGGAKKGVRSGAKLRKSGKKNLVR
uniref:RRP12-like protein n=1 Tax=Hirondellea gigas TaxID=1518452 RepID=A0A2P2HZC8_9CRUS